ncbi:hypothetical protein PIB30_081401 [Stylosanthes scabra]|uniref:Uncharacterized protein n=1 Tax=Stylosanthes scabra TaxID=79078 RepID=A0ABU6RRJ0_9FABA|nr:hypothetical protein [Stylosanthes scabra]
MLEDLIKEGSERQRSQRKLDFQSVAMIQLASQVLQNSSIRDLPTKNTLDAVTLRSGTKLKGPPLPAQVAEPLLQNTQAPEIIDKPIFYDKIFIIFYGFIDLNPHNCLALGIKKCMGMAKEGIGSKGFMKRSKKGGFWILQVATEVASEVAHATLEQRAVLILSRLSWGSCACNFLPCSLLRVFWNRVVTDTLRPLSRPVRDSLVFKTDSIVVEESKPIVILTAGFRQQEKVSQSLQPIKKLSSIELGSFSLGIEILWLGNGCENIGVAMVEYQ